MICLGSLAQLAEHSLDSSSALRLARAWVCFLLLFLIERFGVRVPGDPQLVDLRILAGRMRHCANRPVFV
jgi:hypothetical protein